MRKDDIDTFRILFLTSKYLNLFSTHYTIYINFWNFEIYTKIMYIMLHINFLYINLLILFLLWTSFKIKNHNDQLKIIKMNLYSLKVIK